MYSLYPSSIPTIFITPTPFRHDIWRDRDPEVTAQYGEAAKDLAKELGIGFVDSQKEFKGKKLEPLLSDGLHLKPAGYEVRCWGLEPACLPKRPWLGEERDLTFWELCHSWPCLCGLPDRFREQIVFDAFMRLIREKHPELAPERLPLALPRWVGR